MFTEPESTSSQGSPDPDRADAIRREFADAWGAVGSRWGIPPATARVHGYLLAHRGPLTEREVRLALGLSHRAASMALAESEAWGLIERIPEPRRAGRRGPAGSAWVAVGDHWRWFGRVVEQRRLREGDPAVAAIEGAANAAGAAAADAPDDAALSDLRDRLVTFLGFVRLFDRAAALVAHMPPAETANAMNLLGQLPDATVLRLVSLLASVPGADIVPLLNALGRVPPSATTRAVRLAARLVHRLG